MITVSVKVSSNLFKKLDETVMNSCIDNVVSKATTEAESRCRTTCPYATGALSRGHYSEITGDMGAVKNSRDYATYVIHGTSRMEARNYPLAVINSMSSQNFIANQAKAELRKSGVTR